MSGFSHVLLLMVDVDQHADDAELVQGHPLTHSSKTCRNALHTANYCTTDHREERGGR